VEGLMSFIPGPDFPTYGIIHGGQGIYDAYATGRGSIKIRGEVAVEKDKKGNDETIVITELPYQVNKARLIEKIADLVKNKVIEGIRYVRDESDKEGMRVAIGLKRQQFAEVIVNQLYKHTRLQHSFGINLLAVVNNRPEVLTLKEIFEYFILHRKEIIIRRTRFELKKAEDRAHILEGLKTAIDNLDEVDALIRRASSPAEAKAGLIQRFELTAVQAQAILDMRLQKLTGLERDKIITEYQEVLKQIAYYREILASEKMVLDLIKEELSELKENFGDERRTRIVGEASREINLEDMIVEEDMVVTVSRSGYIKRNPISLYKKQLRGGKGKTAMGTKEDDFVDRLFIASTHHTFLFFTNRGKVYWRKVYEIPQAGRASRGSALVNLLELEEGEMLATVLNVPDFEPGYYILMATRNGLVKKTDLMAYSRPRAGGIIALGLADDDELIAARITDGSWNVFLGAAGGKSVRFLETDVRPTGRISRGVRGMRLDSGDRLVGMEVLSHGKTLLTITENGYGKRTSIDEYPIKKRGGKGIITIKTSARNGMVVGILLVEDEDEAMIMTDAGKIIRISMKSISVISRNTQGVRLIGLDEDESVTGVARLAEEKETDDDQDDVMAADMTSGPDGADHD
ncbi:MAG: DNA gyrase subunit A, partial [Desulfosudaceae bacterium]